MTGSSLSTLTVLQRELLAALIPHAPGFFLTGRAVLAGWILGHRRTDDLDLFTEDDAAMAEADRSLRAAAAEVGADVEATRSHPDFRRYVVRRGSDGVVVDFVRERVPALYPRVIRDGIPMDSVDEIVVNKLCALVGRVEVRDVIDLWHLDRSGYRADDYVDQAAKKDGGVTPATVAYALAEFPVPVTIAPNVDRDGLTAFIRDLEMRMRRLALPKS